MGTRTNIDSTYLSLVIRLHVVVEVNKHQGMILGFYNSFSLQCPLMAFLLQGTERNTAVNLSISSSMVLKMTAILYKI